MLRKKFAPAILAISVLALFAPTLNHDFVELWDDNTHITENRRLNQPSISNTIKFWKEPYIGLYIPLTYTVWSAIASISKRDSNGMLNPQLFHAVNIALHIINSLILFGILKLLLMRGFGNSRNSDVKTELAACIGAFIFAIHPVQVSPVAWATGTKGLLSGMFSLLAIKEYLLFSITSKVQSRIGICDSFSEEEDEFFLKSKSKHYTFASVYFVLAILSKPVAIILPLIMFTLDKLAINRKLIEGTRSLSGLFLFSIIFALITKSVQPENSLGSVVSLLARPIIAGDTITFYLYKLFLPINLGIDYGRTPQIVLQNEVSYLLAIIPIAIAAAIWSLKKERAIWSASFAIFTIALLPVLGFVPFKFQDYSTVADRYLYLPMVGVSIIVSTLFLKLDKKRTLFFASILVLLLASKSFSQIQTWQNSETLFTNALKVNSNSYISATNLGFDYLEKGMMEKALASFKTAEQIKPEKPLHQNNVGTALALIGSMDEAIIYFHKAVKLNPKNLDAVANLIRALKMQGKNEEAMAEYQKAIKLHPDSPILRDIIGTLQR